MAEFLVFTLWAPMAAMGDVAVGERRVGGNRPARSAVLGLVAAAIGIERDDEAGLSALSDGYGMALLVERTGDLLQDYHSTQIPKPGRHRRKATRREELADLRRLNTILTLREYRTDPWSGVALWARPSARYPLGRLGEALERPRFTLYFGRKACPLGLPTSPRLVDAETVAAAFSAHDGERPEAEREIRRRLGIRGPGTLYADADSTSDGGPTLGAELARVERRRDVVVNRRRWQFGMRDELVARAVATTPSGSG